MKSIRFLTILPFLSADDRKGRCRYIAFWDAVLKRCWLSKSCSLCRIVRVHLICCFLCFVRVALRWLLQHSYQFWRWNRQWLSLFCLTLFVSLFLSLSYKIVGWTVLSIKWIYLLFLFPWSGCFIFLSPTIYIVILFISASVLVNFLSIYKIRTLQVAIRNFISYIFILRSLSSFTACPGLRIIFSFYYTI